VFFGDDDDNGSAHTAYVPTGGGNSSAVSSSSVAEAAAGGGAAYFKATGQGQGQGANNTAAGRDEALEALISSCYHTGYSSQAFRYITAFCFLFLAAATATLGGKVSYLDTCTMPILPLVLTCSSYLTACPAVPEGVAARAVLAVPGPPAGRALQG
jgi:hypothetical protein